MTPEDYDTWYHSGRGRWIGETEYRLLLQLLAPRAGEQVLDVGCGTGWFTRRLARLPGVSVTGLDLDESWLGFARSRDPQARYVQGDARSLPFEDGSYDRVLSVTALCFVPEWPQALAEIVRVSRRRFVLGLLNRHGLLWRDKGRAGGQGAYRGAHWHTATEIRQALVGLPVDNVQVRSAVLFPGGSPLARLAERGYPTRLPFGSFLVLAGDKISGGHQP